MQLTRTLYVLCAGVCHDTGPCPWPFVLWTLLSCARINGCVTALMLKHSHCFYYFRGCVCIVFRVYSGVGVVGVQLTKYSLDVMREYGRHGEPCNWSQDCVKHACTGRQRLSLASALFCQIELLKRSCWSFPPPEIASLPTFSSCPKPVFPRFPLVAAQLTYPSPVDISVLYSRVFQTNFGRSHPKNSNWEGKIHCAHVQAKVLYWEHATEAVWLQICPGINKFHFFSFFETLFVITVSFTIVIRRSPGRKSASSGRSISKSTCVVPAWTLTSENAFFWVCASRWSSDMTSSGVYLFWKCLQWSCLKAVSVPSFLIEACGAHLPPTSLVITRRNNVVHVRCAYGHLGACLQTPSPPPPPPPPVKISLRVGRLAWVRQ